MNLLKYSLITATAAAILSSCGSSAPLISTPFESIDTLPLKITPITDEQLKMWSSSDLANDTIPGMGVDRTYAELLIGKTGQKVIVGVIDSGVDIEHEDLKNIIWTNKGEIAGNNKDDDKNGYIDDIHGWNFLGNIVEENMEYVRIIRKLIAKYEGKSENSVSVANREEFAMYQKAKAEYSTEVEKTQGGVTQMDGLLSRINPAHDAVSKKLGKADYSKKELSSIENPSPKEQEHMGILTQMFNYGETIPEVLDAIQGQRDYNQGRMDSHFNMTKDFRGAIGDNPDDNSNPYYGNGDVDGPTKEKEDAKHGTHVSGIIAAQRNNGIGMNGIANNVEIMVIRAVPDGDEYDKDIANAIRYAVDNGAKVLNTSFGKYYSTHPEWVNDAIKYAAKKDVLIVNAAGNEGLNLDETRVYPNDQLATGAEISDTFLTVGALNYKYGGDIVANFSNYGKTNVDVFAPGVKIWATTPLNTYEYLQGTSMAAPNVAGVAAMIRSYYPKLSAKQVKQILMDSGLSTKTPVVLGGDPSNVGSFTEISTSGKMVSMYNAFIMASKM